MTKRLYPPWLLGWSPHSTRGDVAIPPEGDRRGRQRHPCRLEATCRLAEPLRGPTWPAIIWDLSHGGVGVLLRRGFRQGTILTVQAQITPQSPVRTLMVEVVRSVPQGDCWLLGCVMIKGT